LHSNLKSKNKKEKKIEKKKKKRRRKEKRHMGRTPPASLEMSMGTRYPLTRGEFPY
jgi:hypothetical protein